MLPPARKCSASWACNARRSPWNHTSNRSQIGQRSLLIALGRECQLNYFSRSWKWFLANLLDTYAMQVMYWVSQVNKQSVHQDRWVVLTGQLWFRWPDYNGKSLNLVWLGLDFCALLNQVNVYFHYWLICILFVLINWIIFGQWNVRKFDGHFFYHFLRANGNIYKLLFLSNQQSKIKRNLIHIDIKLKKKWKSSHFRLDWGNIWHLEFL